MKKPEKKITVCANCLSEACWHGNLFCEKYRTAGTVEMTKKQLAEAISKRLRGEE